MSDGARFCPVCGSDLDLPQGFVTEYWRGDDRWFLCWCPECASLTTVCLPTRIVSVEPEH